MKTYSQKISEVTRKWYLIDANGLALGRLSTEVAKLLTGKHKPTYTPNTDGGDYVVVVNAEKVSLSGAKETDKMYYRHSGYPGGLKEATAKDIRAKRPEMLIEEAVRGMIHTNKLKKGRLERLKVFAGNEHDHNAQSPINYKVGK